jgi:hypothetical protein
MKLRDSQLSKYHGKINSKKEIIVAYLQKQLSNINKSIEYNIFEKQYQKELEISSNETLKDIAINIASSAFTKNDKYQKITISKKINTEVSAIIIEVKKNE